MRRRPVDTKHSDRTLLIMGLIATLPEIEQARIRECVQKCRALLDEYEEAGFVAFALVGSELQDKHPL